MKGRFGTHRLKKKSRPPLLCDSYFENSDALFAFETPVVIEEEKKEKEDEEERVFEHYMDLSELRKVLIEWMEPDDRCRLTRCSKLCSLEAKSSKTYMYSLKISKPSVHKTEIEVLHGPNRADGYGFHLKYERSRKFCTVDYTTLDNKSLWKKTIVGAPKNRLHNSSEYFKYLLKSGQNSIKHIFVPAKVFGTDFDFEINRLPNLKELGVEAKFLPQFLPKLQRPLETLYIYEQENNDFPADCTQKILQVQDYLFAPFTKFDYKQFLQLSAKCASIHIGKIKEIELADFIKSWKHGKIETNLLNCTWNLKGSDFKVDHIFKQLGAVLNRDGCCRINHLKEEGRHIMLYSRSDSLACVWKD